MSNRSTTVRRRFGSRIVAAALLATGAVVGIVATDPTEALDPTAPQEAFLCTTEWNGLGQPIVDNQDGVGTPVYPESGGTIDRSQNPIGWSRDCQADTRVDYRYLNTSGQIVDLPSGATSLPADIQMIPASQLLGSDLMDLGGDAEIPYLFRYERATLPQTRFIYSTAMLVPFDEVLSGTTGGWNHDHWNGRLVFSFGGGVGIGHSQGDLHGRDSQLHDALRLGHAVVYSSGTRTSTHYNLLLGGRTATEVKAEFTAEHGAPEYTVGIGGSGGGIQQYVYAQNIPDLLDGLMPQYSYPDMTTQTIAVGDCELLERYMDVDDGSNPRWRNWNDRKILQGLNTLEGYTSSWQGLVGTTGSSECIEGWRGATPLALNPTFGLAVDMEKAIAPYQSELISLLMSGQPIVPADFPDLGRMLRTSPDPADHVEWTHWADAAEAYGVDPDTGFARSPWDNVGVQYGLRAIASGQIGPEEFLDLNTRIGSWKSSEDAVPESCGMVKAMAGDDVATLGALVGICSGNELDQYSTRMMNLGDGIAPAPRTEADITAITNAFTSGLEFDGRLGRDLPILDLRHYLEEDLDMHNVHQSFTVRERIRRTMGSVDNHVIWFLDARPGKSGKSGPVTDDMLESAFQVMDEWIPASLAGAPAGDVKPAAAIDSCWATDGTLVGSGDGVWNGAVELSTSGSGAWTGSAPTEVDGVPVGACASYFPIHSNSRIIAGAPITNDVYKCHLKPVTQAIEDGDYGDWTPTSAEQAELEAIFPTGVCDWSRRSVGHPSEGEWVPPTTTTTTEATTTTTEASTTTDAPTTTGEEPTTTAAAEDPTTTVARSDAGATPGDKAPSGPLPRTGSDPRPLLALGAAMLVLGAALLTRNRRRRLH